MKAWQVHYLNKYPGGNVEASDSSFRVYNADGKLVICMNFSSGDGQWHDKSEEMGLSGRHDLAPIPKDSRLFKLVNGKIAQDEMFEKRSGLLEQFQDDSGMVMSCAALAKDGWAFDEKQKVESKP